MPPSEYDPRIERWRAARGFGTEAQATFRLDRPQAYPASFIAARQSLSESDVEHIIAGRLPGGWPSGAENAAPASSRRSEQGNDGEPDPEEWARQRRMSSLLSGIGAVFGTVTLSPVTLAEENEPDSEDDDERARREGFPPGIGVPLSSSPQRVVLASDPETSSSVGSGSECFESAEEGEEGAWSPSGRRISTGGRRKSHVPDPFSATELPTIIDNSPVLRSTSVFQRAPSPAVSAHPEVSISFGYAYDAPIPSEPTVSPPAEEEAPKSVKQLVRESWRFQQPLSADLTPEEEKRLWTRATERLGIDDEGLSLQITDMVGSKLAVRSSYTPSSRPLVTRSNTTSTTSSRTSPPQLSPQAFPTLSPLPASDYFATPRQVRARHPTTTSHIRPVSIIENSLRRRSSSASAHEYDALLIQYGRIEMRRQEVIFEMCETERSFVTGLRGVTRVFTLPLRTPDGAWIKGVPIPVSRLLDWLDDILAVHARISDALQVAIEKSRLSGSPILAKVADVFLPYVGQLEVHQPYLVRFEAVTQAIDSMTADSASDFGEFVRMQSSLPECGALSLSSFLLKPVQRLMKYPLFFKQLSDLTPPTHSDRVSTLSLLHSTDSMIRVMQEVKTREDEYEEAKVLELRIRGLPESFKLARRDRRLVAHGPLRRVHISDRDRTILEMDAMSRANSATPRTTNVLTLAPDAAALAPAINGRRHSTISDSGSSSRSVGSLTHSETSSASRTSPSTPVHSTFETLLRPESLSFGNFSITPEPKKAPTIRLVKTKAKESLIYVFVFSDVVVLATKSTEPARFIRTSKTSSRRFEQGPSYKALETIGLSRVLGVSDLSGKTEHDHLLEVDLLPMPAGDDQMPSFSLHSAAQATSIYFTVPGRPSSSTRSSSAESPAKERVRWLQAFERSYLFALRSLSFPNYLSAHTAPITMNERLSCTSFLDVGVVPKSPSEQQLDRIDDSTNVTSAKPGGAQAEREERAYWAVRLKKLLIATQALSHGKLTIMRSTADETEEGRKVARALK
ncbi:hypothetical protein RQP46_006421 [Phenoliferia psychrophenolica]